MTQTTEETWEAYATRLLADPGSSVRQLMDVGISRDVAFILHFLSKQHEQQVAMVTVLDAVRDNLQTIAGLLEVPEDDWRKGKE